LRCASCLLLVALLAAPSVLSAQNQERERSERVVRRLKFVGNHALDDYTLSSAIATTNSSTFATNPLVRWLGLGEKRYLDELEFRRDVVRLLLLYRQSGYMTAVVDTNVIRTTRDAYITFRIYEGDPVRVARLDVQGVAGILDTAQLRRTLPLQVGDAFNRFLLQASADTIASRLRNSGYPYAEVLRNFDSEAGVLRAEVTLEAIPGAPMRVGEVMIQGLKDVDTGTVRRLLTVHPGDRYRQDALYQSQRDLYSMGVFRYANVILVDSSPPAHSGAAGDAANGASDSTVRVLVQVQEGPQHRLRFGLGYGSVDCLRAQTGWTANDFLGGGRTLDVSARLSKIGGGSPPPTTGFSQLCKPFFSDTLWSVDTLNYTLGATLRQPAFISRAHSASVGVFAERRSEAAIYTRIAVGANADVTINARRQVPVTIGYGYSVGRTDAEPAVYCSVFRLCDSASQVFLRDRRAFGAITITTVRDRVNNPLDPSEGSLVTATFLYASRLVGSDSSYEFNRAEFEVSHYYPIGRRAVFAWRVRGGTILPQKITLSGQRVGYVPPDQRFYGGGPNSVRGYGRNGLGPRVYISDSLSIDNSGPTPDTTFYHVTTAPTGGNSAFVLNAELRFPSPIFAQRMRLGLFVDVGQVWERGDELVAIQGVRVTPGAGVRFTTPLGPVRVDVAYNGYPAESGPLLLQTADSIVQKRSDYAPSSAGKSFWQRLVLQLAVGQAF